MRLMLAIAALLLGLGTAAVAVQPDEVLKNPALERRAREISSGLRCLVCQNQSIDDSDADLARDLRLLVRERLSAGDTDSQVRDFVVRRYGEFVLLRPALSGRTIALWFSPLLILIVGAAGIILVSRRRRVTGSAAPLDMDETRAVEDLLNNDKGTSSSS